LNASSTMAFVGMAKGSLLYSELNVAVPNISGCMTSRSGGCVGGMFDEELGGSA
jgi:hypothetical protein